MFDFLFKRSAKKPSEPAPVASAQAAAATAQVSRRAEQVAQAQALAGDEAAAARFILTSEFADARLIAAAHVQSQPLLEQVQQAMRNTDRRVAKLMQSRLELLRHEQAEQAKAQAAVDMAQRLLGEEKLSPNQVADLDRSWQVVKAPAELAAQFAAARAALAQRLGTQVALQRAMIDAVAALRALPGAGLAAPQFAVLQQGLVEQHALHLADAEHPSLPKQLQADFAVALTLAQAALQALEQHQAAIELRQAALAQWQEIDPAGLQRDAVRRAWQALPHVPDGALADALQQQFDAIVGAIPAPPEPEPEAPRKPKLERSAGAASATADPDAARRFIEALDGMEAALQQGLLQLASEHDKTLRELKSGRLTPGQSERLAQVRAEFKRLADWARWGGNVSREELVKAADDLAKQELGMAELARKVGSLRERWKSLDTLSGSAPKSLWERFDAACSQAYAPAAAHFKQLADERHANAAKAEELIAETDALASAGGDDWKQLAATAQRLRQGWSRLGTIERKEKKRLDSAFGAALAALEAPLEHQRQIETARREQLIVEVGLLKPTERNTVDMLRALQDKWQELAKALPLERRAEQALWQRFRAACDDIFERRKETAQAADHERRDHLQAKEAICAGLETAVLPQQGGPAAMAALLREARNGWQAIGPVPRVAEAAIEQRYQDAQTALQAQADAIAQRASAAQANAVRDKLRLCQALEDTVAAQQDQRGGPAWQARWDALPTLDAVYERSLQGRFDAALTALATPGGDYARVLESNRARLQEEVLRLEIVSGVDSGAEFARERLKMQVDVLQSSLKSGQKPVTQLAQLLQLCAIPALVDARTAHRIEILLRRIGAAGEGSAGDGAAG